MSGVIDPESSVELFERYKAGDADALERLVRRYLPALRRWAKGRLPPAARGMSDTHDLVNDAFLRALKHLPGLKVERPGAVLSYLRQIVLNLIRDEARRGARRPPAGELPDDLPANGASPLDRVLDREQWRRYDEALASLRPEEQETIIARMELGLSYGEIAVMLGKPSADAARVAVQRTLIKLAGRMSPAAPVGRT